MTIAQWNSRADMPIIRQPATTGGEGMARVGDALTRAGVSALDQVTTDQRRQQAEAQAKAERAQAQRETLAAERIVAEQQQWADGKLRDLRDAAEPGAPGMEDQAAEAWTQQRAQVLADPRVASLSAETRDLLATRLDLRVGHELTAKAGEFAAGSRINKQVEDWQAILDARANRVLSDPDSHDAEAQDMAGLLMHLQLPADRMRKVAEATRATLAKAAVRGQIDRDPMAAKEWLDGGRFDRALDPDAKAALLNAATAGIHQRDAEARQAAALTRAEVKADLADYEAALRAGRSVDYDPARILSALGPQAGRQALDMLDQAGKFGADAVRIRYASPDELAAILKERQAAQSGETHPVSGRPVIHNPDGTISTEESITVTDERLNGGRPTNIPSIWGGKRPPANLDAPGRENWAIEQALKSGQTFQAFDSIDSAVKAAEDRTAMLGRTANDVRGFKERQQDLHALSTMVAERNRALAADPAAYVAEAPAVADRLTAFQQAEPDQKPAAFAAYVTATLTEQERLGVPAPLRRVLPKENAATQVQALHQAKPEDAADAMAQSAALYGRHWPAAYRDLVKAGLSREYQVLATTTDPVGRANLAAALSQDKDALRQAVAANAKEIDQAVTSAMEPLYRSLSAAPDGQDIGAAYEKAAKLLAYRYATSMDPADAAEKAAQDVALGRWDFVPGNASGQAIARAPKGAGDMAQQWGQNVLDRLTAQMVADPGDPKGVNTGHTAQDRQAIALRAARDGAWLTNEDGTGWIRVYDDGQPVMLADGKRLEFRFADIGPLPPAPAPYYTIRDK